MSTIRNYKRSIRRVFAIESSTKLYTEHCTKHLIRISFMIHIHHEISKEHIGELRGLRSLRGKLREITKRVVLISNAISRNSLIPLIMQFFSNLLQKMY